MSKMDEYAAAQLGRIADALERIVVHFQRAEVPEYDEQRKGAYRHLSDTVLDALAAGLNVDGILRNMMPQTYSSLTAATVSSDYEAAVQGIKDMPDDIPPEPEAEKVEKADVIAALNKYAAKHGIAKGKEVLNTFAPRLDDVAPEKYADVIRALEVLK